jgi:hypothetical protein
VTQSLDPQKLLHQKCPEPLLGTSIAEWRKCNHRGKETFLFVLHVFKGVGRQTIKKIEEKKWMNDLDTIYI